MSNFRQTFLQGKEGKNFGLTTGLTALDKAINGIQKKQTISVAAAPKCGKTTLVDYSFVLSPYLQAEAMGILDNLEIIYYSYEIDRVSKEFKFAAFFMAHDYSVFNFMYKGKLYNMSQEYLMGRLMHHEDGQEPETVRVTEEHETMIKEIYLKRIVPMFGEFDNDGKQVRPGKIIFIEERDNPTGMYKFMLHYAKKNGKFAEESYKTLADDGKTQVTKTKISGYVPNNPDKFVLIVTDHVRRLRRERGFSMKDTIDKWLEYSTDIRNWCGFTFIHIIHSNRNLANVDRLKFAGEFIFPTSDDCKDSGNPAEESTVFMTLFNPNDEKYNLQRHFGRELKDYPNYRSIHITESRYTECPAHIQVNMFGGINTFGPLDPV